MPLASRSAARTLQTESAPGRKNQASVAPRRAAGCGTFAAGAAVEGRIMQGPGRASRKVFPVIAPTFRQRGEGSPDEIAQLYYGDLGRYSNTSELPMRGWPTARDIRRAIVDARNWAQDRTQRNRSRMPSVQRKSMVSRPLEVA